MISKLRQGGKGSSNREYGDKLNKVMMDASTINGGSGWRIIHVHIRIRIDFRDRLGLERERERGGGGGGTGRKGRRLGWWVAGCGPCGRRSFSKRKKRLVIINAERK